MASKNIQQANSRLIRRLLLVTVCMFGFGFAMVPLYNVFCAATGINGKTGGAVDPQKATAETVDADRLVTVEFMSTVSTGLPWEFRPVVRKMEVHPGRVYEAKYFVRNQSAHAVVGQAVPSVAPGQAAKYFNKVECFCFTQQTLEARQEREMPIRFVVDPDLPPDVATVTLSYTFFKMEGGRTGDEQDSAWSPVTGKAHANEAVQL